jgi:hypothetical protein
MIKIVEPKEPKKPKKAKKPYYELEYDYMIGDANGSTSEKVRVSLENPFVERYVTLLNKLKPVKGSWGVQLESSDIYGNFDEKRITEDDCNFLIRTMFGTEGEEDDGMEPYFTTDSDNKFADEFADGVRAETEYSFLVFEGIELYYYDENGKKNNTKILKTKAKTKK